MKTVRHSIVGAQHRGFDQYLTGILPGTEILLIREPDNKYDKNAVMVWIDGKHVGYLPSKTNLPVALKIDREGQTMAPAGASLGRAGSEPMARDAAIFTGLGIRAKFARSPNSAFPQAEIEE